jgi:cell filamentation protein
VNYVHPFREGNGRSQLQYLKLLAAQAGHSLNLTKIDAAGWLEASREAHRAVTPAWRTSSTMHYA